jgi:hypothetical protein
VVHGAMDASGMACCIADCFKKRFWLYHRLWGS